ncbi:hypothetical protein FACS1894151_08880 [Spirochaetia bacterium]|nr:hypothetical protein FACS1894151_08880 [Spirochaetia bacterium]
MKIVLSVDDVSVNLATIRTILSRHFDVRIAKSGNLALLVLNHADIDLVLLDISMPDMSGFDVLDRIRQIPGKEHIPVIFVTSFANKEFIDKAIQVGAAGYIVKPYSPNTLISKINAVLGGQDDNGEADKSAVEAESDAPVDEMDAFMEILHKDIMDILKEHLVKLNDACITGRWEGVENSVKELGNYNFGMKINRILDEFKHYLTGFDYHLIIRKIPEVLTLISEQNLG